VTILGVNSIFNFSEPTLSPEMALYSFPSLYPMPKATKSHFLQRTGWTFTLIGKELFYKSVNR
jgi:hypothetical protein